MIEIENLRKLFIPTRNYVNINKNNNADIGDKLNTKVERSSELQDAVTYH